MLEASSLTIGYRNHPVLSDLNLKFEAGTFVALLGANGSGKSTLLRTLTGALAPISGSVTIDGQPLASLSRRAIARAVSIVTTERAIAGGLTVEQLVGLGRQPYTSMLGRMSDADKAIVDHAISDVGIAQFRTRPLAHLSDGERQKAMIARALAQDTPTVILDEPTAFLDPAGRAEIMALLRKLALDPDNPRAILLSTHDVALATTMCTHLWLIDARQHTILACPTESAISSGAMDCLFPDASVKFDPQMSDFRPC